MFMQFSGGGIGHKVTDHVQQRTPTGVHNAAPNSHDKAPDPHDEVPNPHNDTIPHDTQDYPQAGDDDGDGDPKEVDTDEEADYGYVDGPESKSEDGESEDGEGRDGEGEEETDADMGDDEAL